MKHFVGASADEEIGHLSGVDLFGPDVEEDVDGWFDGGDHLGVGQLILQSIVGL